MTDLQALEEDRRGLLKLADDHAAVANKIIEAGTTSSQGLSQSDLSSIRFHTTRREEALIAAANVRGQIAIARAIGWLERGAPVGVRNP